MQKTITILLVALGFFTNAQSNFNYAKDFKTILAKTKDKNDKWNYDKLLSRFNKNDTTLTNAEVLALLIGFTDKPAYKPYQDLKQEKLIYDLNAEGKYDEALEKANEYIKFHPLSVKVIFERAFAHYKAHMQDSAKYIAWKGYKIFQAMKWSGDGKTKENPMFSLGVEDGQDYIVKFMGCGIDHKAYPNDNAGNLLSSLEVTSRISDPYNLYFIIQHARAKK